MVKVCHITSVHPKDDIRIFWKECVSLAKNGCQVYLIACDDEETFSEINGVKIITLNVPVKNRMQRMLKRTSAVYNKALRLDADVYHLHDPELMFIGLLLKKKGKKIIFDSHEDVPALILSKDWIPSKLRKVISNIYSFVEKLTLKRYNALISVTPVLTNRLKEINSNTYQISNFPILEFEVLTIRPEFNNNSITFAGGINKQWNHHILINVLSKINEIKYNLAGYVQESYHDELKQLPAWPKVNYIGKLPHNKVSHFLSESSIGMALCSYSPNVGGKMGSLGNTKLFEYMMIGLPVVCTDFELWKEIVEKNDCGICVNPFDEEKIYLAIEELINNKEKARIMGENGRKIVVDYYNWGTQEKVLLELYSNFK